MTTDDRTFSIYRHDGGDFPTLPGAFQREAICRCLDRLSVRLGLRASVLRSFRVMIGKTRPSDFKDPGREPCCYVSQTELALELGLSTKQLRTHEKALMARGLIEKRTLANGARSGHPECGIFFSAAIAMFDRLQSMADTAEKERKEHARLRRLRSTHLRHVRSALCELAAIEASAAIVTPVMTAVSGWPSNDALKTWSLDALRAHEAEARALARDVTDPLSKIETTSGEPHRNFPSHIQDSTEDSNLSCSEGRVERTSGEPSEDFSVDPASDEARKGRGKKDARPEAARKNRFIETLTPERLYAICPDTLRWQLDIERGAGRDLTVHDFDCAVQALLPMHGISDDAYREAFETMGPQLTTFCLVITYARADNPDDPLRAPGGYLRSLTRACRAGELNIAASIFGLANRSASETPRRLVPRPRRHENPDSSALQPMLGLMRRTLPRSTLQ